MANRQQDSTADKLRAIYAPQATAPPKKTVPSAVSTPNLDAHNARASRGILAPNQNTNDLQDFGTNLNIGARQIPGMVSGLLDIPAGLVGLDRPVDKVSSAIGRGLGVDNKASIAQLRTELSPATQASQRKVEATKGFFPSIGAYLDNPRAIAADVTASLPATVAGGGLGGVIAKTATKVALTHGATRATAALSNRAVAAGIGEGAVAAGAQMDTINKEIDPFKAAVSAVGTGVATAVIAGTGAHFATKLGIGDPDLVFVGSRPMLAPGVSKKNIWKRMGFGAVSEGVFQEMPQGAFEQISQNWAEDKDLLDGVEEAAVASLMSGMGMGLGAGAINVGGPQEFISPTSESGNATPSGTQPGPGAPGVLRTRDQVTDKKLVGGIVAMGQLYDEANTPAQQKIIGQHLREAQAELKRRGIDPSIVDAELSEANFGKISERIEKNIALSKGLAAKDVDRAGVVQDSIDADIQRLVRLEQVHPGTRVKHMDTMFADKMAALVTLSERVTKNRSKRSRASKASKQKNSDALKAATIELEILLGDNPELADRFEAAGGAPAPVAPAVAAPTAAVPLSPEVRARAVEMLVQSTGVSQEEAGELIDATDQPVGDQPTAVTDQESGETSTPEPSKKQLAERARRAAEKKRRAADSVDGTVADPSSAVARTARERLAQLLGATQSTTGLPREPSALPQRVPDDRPAPAVSFADRVLDQAPRRIYIKKNGQLTKRGQQDLDKFESLDVATLISVQEENAAREKQTPLIVAQQELIQDILDTTKSAELDAFIEESASQRAVDEPLSPAEMENIIIAAQNTGVTSQDLTGKQLRYFQMYNDFVVNEGRDNPVLQMQLQLYREGTGRNRKLPDDSNIREQVSIAAQKIIKAIMTRRGLRTRREAELLLGPMFHGLAKPTDPNTGFRHLSLMQAQATNDPDEIRMAKERMQDMRDLDQDIVQKGATNDAPGINGELVEKNKSGLPPAGTAEAQFQGTAGGEVDVIAQNNLGTRGSVNESAPHVAGSKGVAIAERLQLMGIGATPKQAGALQRLGTIKASVQDEIDLAQRLVDALEELGENLPMLHASDTFDDAGDAWNKATARSKQVRGIRWAKVRNDPWLLDRWMTYHAGVTTEFTRPESDTATQFRRRVSDMLTERRDELAVELREDGNWLERSDEARARLDKATTQLADVLGDETKLLKALGATIDTTEKRRNEAPTAPGAAPTINYSRHARREITPKPPAPLKRTRTQAPAEKPPTPVHREPQLVEHTASLFVDSPFAAGSLRSHNPDVEVAAVFAEPGLAAAEGTHAVLVTTTADKFLARVAAIQAEDTGTKQADRERALKSSSYTGAAEALEGGKKLTAPTLDHRVGSVSGVDHVLANVAAGSNKVHYVEMVTTEQLAGVEADLKKSKGFTHRVVAAAEAVTPTTTETAKPPLIKKKGTRYSMADHERQLAQGGIQRGTEGEAQSLRAVLKNTRKNATKQRRDIRTRLNDIYSAIDTGTAPRLSIAQQPVENPSTVESIGPVVDKYSPGRKRERITVVQSMVDLESYLAQHSIEISAEAGGLTHNGRVTLIADNIEAGTAAGVIMHEVGVHMGLKPFQINQLAKAIEKMARDGNKAALAAMDAVDAATDTMSGYGTEVTDFDVNHEIVAYFVENSVNAGIDPTQLDVKAGDLKKFFNNLVTLIRTTMRAMGLSTKALTAQDVVDAAYGAADTVFRDPVTDPTPRMSVASAAREATNRTYNQLLGKHPRARDQLAVMKHHTQRVGQTFLFAHDFADMVTNLLPTAAEYFRLVAKRVTAQGRFDSDLQHHKNKAKDFTKDQYDAVNDYFIQSQVVEAWGFTPHEGALSPNKIDRGMEVMFGALNPAQQTFIKESFAMADQLQQQRESTMRNEIEQAVNDMVQRESDPVKQQTIQLQGVADLAKFDKDFRSRKVAWMPLRRHGEYAASFVSDELRAAMDEDPTSQLVREMKGDASHYVVEFHTKLTHAVEAETRLMSASTRPGAVRKFERQAMLSQHELIPGNFMNAMRANLEASTTTTGSGKKQLLQAWTKLYIEQLAETSIRKSELERISVAGFDRDMIHNFTQYGSAIGGTIAGIQLGRETHSIIHKLRSEAAVPDPDSLPRSAALNELLERHAFMLDTTGTPAQDKVMGWVSLNMLLTSPAYFIVNSTQTIMLTLPILAGNFGLADAGTRMGKNYKVLQKAWKAEHSFAPNQMSKLLSGELADIDVIRQEVGDDAADMIVELQELGLFDIGIAADLGSIDNARNVATQAIAKAHRGATHAVRSVEVFNRGVTALTAFQLATADPMKVPVGANGKRPSPREYAIQQVVQTQGDYSGHNAPSLIRRLHYGKLMTQFRKFQLIQIGLLVRTFHQAFAGAGAYEKAMGKRQLGYMLGMHLVAGGALGLPMANIAAMAFSVLGDEDEPDDLEVRLRQEIGDSGTADLLLKGLPAMWGVDVSAKVGMGQTFSVLPFTDIKLNRDSTLAAIGQLITGPAGATAAQLSDAAGQFGDGNYMNAFATALPRGGRDIVRAVMYKNEGLRKKNPTRDTAISANEFTNLDLFMQGIGLPTTRTSGMHSRNRFYQNYKKLVGERSSVIQGDYVLAFEANDPVAMQNARNEWNDLQAARVRNGFKRQSPALLNRAIRRKRQREATKVDGVFVERSERGFLDLMD